MGQRGHRRAGPDRDRAARARHPDRACAATRPRCSAGCGAVDGERFEYELDLLLRASQDGIAVEEVEIETVYLDENASSHFRPVIDSARVYAPLLRFSLSSFGSFLVDTVTLLALFSVTGALLPSVVAARVLSSTVNFVANRRLVFAGGRAKSLRAAATQYGVLAATLLAANFGILTALTGVGIALLPAKVLTEVALFAASYQLQRTVVFAAYGTSRRAGPTYRLSGRISEFAPSCSITCAVHPVIRLATNSGVNVGVSKPMRWYAGPVG